MRNEEKLKEAKSLIIGTINDYEDERLDEAMMLIGQVIIDTNIENLKEDMITWKQLENQSVMMIDGVSPFRHCKLYFNPKGHEVVVETDVHRYYSRSFIYIEFSQDSPAEVQSE